LQYSEKNDNYAQIMAIAGLGIITQSNYSGTSTPPRIGCTTKNDWAEIRFSAFGAFQTPTYAPVCWKADNAQTGLTSSAFLPKVATPTGSRSPSARVTLLVTPAQSLRTKLSGTLPTTATADGGHSSRSKSGITTGKKTCLDGSPGSLAKTARSNG